MKESFKKTIEDLGLRDINVHQVIDKGDHSVILIYGGFNGNGNWLIYLHQIKAIIEELDGWVIELINDCVDDVWSLKVGVSNEIQG